MDGDAYDRRKFLAEEKDRAWASERDTFEQSSPIRFSLGDMRGAFDAGWDCGVIVMEREMSARIRSLESKLAMAIANNLIERTKP